MLHSESLVKATLPISSTVYSLRNHRFFTRYLDRKCKMRQYESESMHTYFKVRPTKIGAAIVLSPWLQCVLGTSNMLCDSMLRFLHQVRKGSLNVISGSVFLVGNFWNPWKNNVLLPQKTSFPVQMSMTWSFFHQRPCQLNFHSINNGPPLALQSLP